MPSSARPSRAGSAGRATPRTDGHAARGGHAIRARRRRAPARPSTRSSRGSAGSASRRSTTSASAWPSPPAEAYGVATFYALFATNPRPPVVAHVCDDIACRLAGAEEHLRRSDAGRRAGRGAGPRRPRDVAAQPVPGPVRPRARGAVHRGRRDARRRSRSRRSTRSASSAGSSRPDRRSADAAARADSRSPARPGRACSPAVGVVDPTSLDDYRAHGGYAALDAGPRDRRRGGHRRGHRVEADGPRRRRVPDRPQVGRGRRPSPPSRTTSSATPTSRSRARSRTASCSRATRSPSSRR